MTYAKAMWTAEQGATLSLGKLLAASPHCTLINVRLAQTFGLREYPDLKRW